MIALRALLANHRRLAALLLALALCMKALVPAGTMVSATAKVITVEICADATRASLTHDIVVPMRGDGTQQQDGARKDGAGAPCGWSALGFGALPAADPVVLALALAFIVLVGLRPSAAPAALRRAHIRPPLRAPPAVG